MDWHEMWKGFSATNPLPPARQASFIVSTNWFAVKSELVTANQFVETIKLAWRAGGNGFVAEKPFHISCQSIGRVVTACAFFLQTLHRDPVQVPSQEMNEFGAIRLAVARGRCQSLGGHGA